MAVVDRVVDSVGGVRFGRAAEPYRRHRAGFPTRFFELLAQHGVPQAGAVLDLGCGTGTIALTMAQRGARVTALDVAQEMVDSVVEAAGALPVVGVCAPASSTGAADATFDVVMAGQCWHWFDRPGAAAEAFRVLRPGGWLVVAHFDWLERPAGVVADTLAILREMYGGQPLPYPDQGQDGFYGCWAPDLDAAGFTDATSFTFSVDQPYTAVDWRGRMQASAAVGATLDPETCAHFDARLAHALRPHGDRFVVPHRVFALIVRKPVAVSTDRTS